VAGAPGSLNPANALFSDGPRPASALTAPVRDVSLLGNDGTACAMPTAGSLVGYAALVIYGNCGFATKITNAQKAGAVAVIIYLDANNSDNVFRMSGVTDTGIPAVLIGNTAGVALKSYLVGNLDARATLDP